MKFGLLRIPCLVCGADIPYLEGRVRGQRKTRYVAMCHGARISVEISDIELSEALDQTAYVRRTIEHAFTTEHETKP